MSKRIRDAALAAIERGWYLLPVKPRGKTPLISEGFHGASRDPERVLSWLRQHPNANLGLYPGKSGLVVLDFDGPEALEMIDALGLSSIDTLTATTGRRDGGEHRYYRHPGGVQIGNRALAKGIDVRADAGYVVMPPSVHPSGAEYIWSSDAPPSELPPNVLEQLLAKPTNASTALAIITPGQRHNALMSLGGSLRRRGCDLERIIAELRAANLAECNPPLPINEVDSIARACSEYSTTQILDDPAAVIEEFNQSYAVVRYGGKVLVLDTASGNRLDLLSRESFRNWNAPRMVQAGKRPMKSADFWFNHPDRRSYKAIVFRPGREVPPDDYNLWRGFGVEPRAGDASLFIAHITECVADGNEEHARFILSWFAQIVQMPAKKLGISLVFRGKQGTGKTIVGKIFGKLLGPHYVLVSNPRFVVGNFNSHQAGALLVQCDEGFFAGDKVAEGILKDLITSDTQIIEQKGVDPIQVDSYVRLLVTSNHEWIIPAGLEERRFAVFDVSDKHIQDQQYFGRLMQQMEGGGYEALLDFLLQYPVDEALLRTIPKTIALRDQQLSSLTPVHEWWFEILDSGRLPGDAGGVGSAPSRILTESLAEHLRHVPSRSRGTATFLGQFLKRFVPGYERRRINHHNKELGSYFYDFPPLHDCRAAFKAVVGEVADWKDGDKWQPDDM